MMTRGFIAKDINNLKKVFDDVRNLPFEVGSYEKALIVGSGGGEDIIRALRAGVKEITAVEINPLIVKFANSFPESIGESFYRNPKVTTIIDDARSYILKSKEKQDLILIAEAKLFGRPLNAHLFIPKNLYTIDAFSNYIDKLNPNGALVIIDYAVYMRNYLKALVKLTTQKGLDPRGHLLLLTDTYGGVGLLMFNISGFSKTKSEEIATAARKYKLVDYGDYFSMQIDARDVKLLTDDNPFLNQQDPRRKRPDSPYSVPKKVVSGFFIFWISMPIVILLVVILIFLLKSKSKFDNAAIAIFFTGISIGLASLQFVLISKVTLLLGNPVFSQSILLSLLLLFGGLGSLLAIKKEIHGNLGKVSLAIAMVMVIYYFLLNKVVAALLPAAYLTKIVVVTVIIFIPAFFSGILFPSSFVTLGMGNRYAGFCCR